MEPDHLNIPVLKLTDILQRCRSQLQDGVGMTVEQTSDFRAVSVIADRIGKKWYNTYLKPDENDFFEPEAFWLIIKNAAGEAIGVVGARHVNTGKTPLIKFYRDRLDRLQPELLRSLGDQALQPPIASKIQGRVVYFGDLFIAPEHRRSDTNYIEIIMLLMFVLSLIKWPETEWMYSFLRASDLARGAAWRYGFPIAERLASSWGVGISGSALEYGLAVIARRYLDILLTGHINTLDNIRVIHHERAAAIVDQQKKPVVV